MRYESGYGTTQYSGSALPAGTRVAAVMVVLSIARFARLVQSADALVADTKYRLAKPTRSERILTFGIFIDVPLRSES